MGGLDYLHISLIVLVIVLIGLAFALAYFKPGAILEDCQYGIQNGTCVSMAANDTQVMQALGRVLAGYSTSNSSLSLLAYYSLVNRTTVSYLPSTKGWLAVVPYVNPFDDNKTFNVSFVFSANLTLEQPFISMVGPPGYANSTTVAFGTVSLDGRSFCAYSKPVPTYFITDPYVPGFIGYLSNAISTAKRYGAEVNMSYYFISSNYAASEYGQYGIQETQNLQRYLACASQQGGFGQFVSNLSVAYGGSPLSNSTLHDIVLGSKLNTSEFAACMDNVTGRLAGQTTLAAFYGINSVPAFIVDCKYETIPATVSAAINYTLDQLPK